MRSFFKSRIAVALHFCFVLVASAQFRQQGPKLVGSGGSGPLIYQGESVALSADGNTALVGGPADNNGAGAAWVFTRTSGAWTQQGSKLVGSGAIGISWQGNSVALSADGNIALVGGPADNSNLGAAWVFTRSGGVWSQQGRKLVGSGAIGSAQQGFSVALSSDGKTALVGGRIDSNFAGAAWVFTRSSGEWSQQGGKLVGSGASPSATQGWSVALSGDGNTALLGGPGDTSGGEPGATWVFTRSDGVWSQQGGKLVGLDAIGPPSTQGWSVALSGDGNTALLGGPGDNPVGAAWVFTRFGGVWGQTYKLVGSGSIGPGLGQGLSVTLSSDGTTALVADYVDNNEVGAVWVFRRSSVGWSQQGGKLVGSGASGPAVQGWSVALSADGNTALVGGKFDNGVVGAVWVFVALPSTTSLSASANPSVYGQTVTFTATVSAGATGTVTFTVDGVVQAPVALNGAQAQFALAGLSVGNHTISAAYGGDSTYLSSTSNVMTQTVNRSPVTLTLTSSANPSAYGQRVLFTATVSAGATGIATFTVDGVAQAPLALTGSQAQLTLANLSAGNHTISAAYSGDLNYLASTSNVLSQTVNPPPPPVTLSLTSSTNPSTVGQAVTFTASLSGGDGGFSGTVQFFDGLISFGSAPVSGGQASLTTSSLSSGSHAIVAKYSGDASAQASLGQVVNGMASTTTVSANPAAILYGQAVVLTAQVGPVPPPGLAAPSGQVTFQDNGDPAGVATLASGTATLTLNTLAVGTHQVTAVYGGDKTWSSSFARVTVTVALPALRLTNAAADLSTSFAPDEAVSMFNVTILNGDTLAPSLPLSTMLNGATVKITDSAGVGRLAQLYGALASRGQVNFVIPGDTAMGQATLIVTGPGGASMSSTMNITGTAPRLFGGGQVLHSHADDPVSDQVSLVLYGTGIRHRSSDANVFATVNGVSVPAESAAQGTYPGLDQVNLQLPHSLAGAGTVDVALMVEGQAANTIRVSIQ